MKNLWTKFNLLLIFTIYLSQNQSIYTYNNMNSFQSNYTLYLSWLSIIFHSSIETLQNKRIWELKPHSRLFKHLWRRPLLYLSILAISFVTYYMEYEYHIQHSSFIIKLDLCYTFRIYWWFLVPFVTSSAAPLHPPAPSGHKMKTFHISRVHLAICVHATYTKNNAFMSVKMHMPLQYAGVFIVC